MIKKISTLSLCGEIECLNRPFTQSSHLIHADETALGIINDRKNRVKKEQEALIILHETRLLNDCITLYSESVRAVNEVYKIKTHPDTVIALSEFHTVSATFDKYNNNL